jgi:hypothetical protein
MISACANPECRRAFDYREGELFRFHKAHKPGEKPPNTHSVQHYWLCGRCCLEYTLTYEGKRGVLLNRRSEILAGFVKFRIIAAA